MLCGTCQAIFSETRQLSYGTYYPWNHTNRSFAAARQAGCHLCNLVWENRSYSGPFPEYDDKFPEDCTYAFKVLNAEWARYGEGQKWLAPLTDVDEDSRCEQYLHDLENEPTVNYLASLLATESDDLFAKQIVFWLVLDFYCAGPRIVLPVEIVRDDVERIAQLNLEEQMSSGTKENMQLASCWLRDCVDNHVQCRPSLDDPKWLPTRLIYLGSVDTPVARLVSTSSLDHRVPYAALSHRWGKTDGYCLTSVLLRRYEVDIPTSNISATLIDAFHITRSIGMQFLWADSMCIIQDDLDDWSRESVTMSKVYGMATCTIAAAVGGNGDDGCFVRRNAYQVRPCQVPNPFKKDSNLSFYVHSQYLTEIYKREVKDSPWYNRGWIFQERTLSPRMLIFGKTQMLWACHKVQASETWPCGKTSNDYIDQFESFEVEKSRLEALLDKDRIVSRRDRSWRAFIEDYSRSDLTKPSDRLIALQGLASQIETVTGRRYCAGLWIDPTLEPSLLWMNDSPIKSPRPRDFRAPTWSWASVDSPVRFPTVDDEISHPRVMIKVNDTVALPNQYQHVSRVSLAALKISARFFLARLIISSTGDLQLFKKYPLPKPKTTDLEAPPTLNNHALSKEHFTITTTESSKFSSSKHTVQGSDLLENSPAQQNSGRIEIETVGSD